MMAKVKKAVKPSQGACRFCLACRVSSPSEGDEDGRPKPRIIQRRQRADGAGDR